MSVNTDPFILISNTAALREAGIPVCGRTLARNAARGLAPAPVRITPRRVGWFRSQLDGWVSSHRPSA